MHSIGGMEPFHSEDALTIARLLAGSPAAKQGWPGCRRSRVDTSLEIASTTVVEPSRIRLRSPLLDVQKGGNLLHPVT